MPLSGLRRRIGWRWPVVAGGLAVLCALPAVASARPVSAAPVSPGQLRTRILAAASRPYTGYAESDATFGLPSLPGLSSVTSLLDGVTRMQAWQAGPDRWRVDVLTDAGERDTYQAGKSSYVWDSGSQLLTKVIGKPSIRLLQASDLLPPSLAARLIREAGTAARLSARPARRIAGRAADGLRVTPTDPDSTVGHIDIWADPGTGLPLDVEIYGKGARKPALETHFFGVGSWTPDQSVLTPRRGPGTGYATTTASGLTGLLNDLAPVWLPVRLAGRKENLIPSLLPIGVYGQGLSTFAVLGLHGSTGDDLLQGARKAGAATLRETYGTGVVVSTPLVTVVLIRQEFAEHRNFPGITYLVAGLASRAVLEQAAATLVNQVGRQF